MFLFEFEQLDEKWSEKYKRSINCANPRGFSQRAHCQGRKKNEELEVVNEKKKRRKNKSAAVGSYGWHGYYYGNSENIGDSGGGIEESTNTTVKEDNTQPKTGTKSAIYSTDVYGSTAYHSKCLEPGCDWESRRYDSIKLAQNAAQKHAQKHFKQGVAENFHDGKKPGRKGLAKRVGVNCKQSVSKLRSIAKNSSGEKQRMAHWCANMKSGKRKVNEGTDYSNLQSALNDFLPLVMQELDLKQLPKIRLLKKINHGGQPSFGLFSSNGINLSVEGRHPVDVCRTLAHELVHYKQGTQNQLNQDSGETGSPEENQANSMAGIIMRKFSQEFPNHIS